ncbi:MAG: hypothetical protein IJ347_07390, partial [Faecalibacterium sp.]|nr:hypothetical protein [Faecalibacterium sp.]
CEVLALPDDADFFRYQNMVNHNLNAVASHTVIKEYITHNGRDYRYQEAPHPIDALDDVCTDNTKVGRCKAEAARVRR